MSPSFSKKIVEVYVRFPIHV